MFFIIIMFEGWKVTSVWSMVIGEFLGGRGKVKIKETITGEPRDKVKVCLEESDDNKKYCQTKKLPQDEDDIVKFKLEYETW